MVGRRPPPPTPSSPSPSPPAPQRPSPATGAQLPFQEFYQIVFLRCSGACIPLANKCNSKIDCIQDESDESHCSYLEVSALILPPTLRPSDPPILKSLTASILESMPPRCPQTTRASSPPAPPAPTPSRSSSTSPSSLSLCEE